MDLTKEKDGFYIRSTVQCDSSRYKEANMSYIHKIVLAFVIVQVAVVLAKPYEPENDDELNQLSDGMENSVYKRAADCGSGCELEGCFSRKCRSSCNYKEYHVSIFDNRCSGGYKCCMCHTGWHNGCAYDN
ncbi:hypothetical protein ACROYT_G031696 [Oculina patagonica]